MGRTLKQEFRLYGNMILEELSKLGVSKERLETIAGFLKHITFESVELQNGYVRSYVNAFPVKNQKGKLEYQIHVNMMKPNKTSRFHCILFHEMSHILSLGEIQEVSESIYRCCWGADYCTFTAINGNMVEVEKEKDYTVIDENMTELCAAFLFERIFNMKYRDPDNPLLEIFHCRNARELVDLITDFVNGDTASLQKNLVLKAGLKNFGELKEKILLTIRKKRDIFFMN